jgi:hypothetical protein
MDGQLKYLLEHILEKTPSKRYTLDEILVDEGLTSIA